MVVTSTSDTAAGGTPASPSALPAAAAAMSARVSPGPAKYRRWIPDRAMIHSSLESMAPATSALLTERAGRYAPRPRIAGRAGSAVRSAVILAPFRGAMGLRPVAVQPRSPHEQPHSATDRGQYHPGPKSPQPRHSPVYYAGPHPGGPTRRSCTAADHDHLERPGSDRTPGSSITRQVLHGTISYSRPRCSIRGTEQTRTTEPP